MQALCPQCSQRIVIDDAKVPDRPFSVKCPKCQSVVKLPGKGAAPETAAPVAGAAAGPAEPVPPHPPAPSADELRTQMMAQIRREMSGGETHAAARALVAFPEHGPAAGIAQALTRLGYLVDSAEEHEDAARLLEQGIYSLVATARVQVPPGKGETLYQRVSRLSPEARRRLFVILVGDEFKSGDGTQAFVVMADLVLSARDATAADNAIRNTLAERTRVYQAFTDARRRFEASVA